MHSFRNSSWTHHALAVGLLSMFALLLCSFAIDSVWIAMLVWLPAHMVASIYPMLTRDVPDGVPEPKLGLRSLVLDVGTAAATVAGLFVASIVLGIVLDAFGQSAALPSASDFAGAAENDASELLYAMLALAVFVAPWTEEIFFRGFLLNAFRARMPLGVALVVQAVIFGAMHASWGLGYAAMTTTMGLVLGGLYVFRDSLRASIIAHGMWNGLTALMILATIFFQAQRPMLGIGGEADADRYVVTKVFAASPAEEAGLAVGDEIVAVDGSTIDSHSDLVDEIQKHEPGEVIQIDITRDGDAMQVDVVLSTRGEVYD